VQIYIRDDGKGLDREKILERARERGLVESSEVPDDVTLFNFIFHPGFSTASAVSHLSGRGVGMDVVRDTVQALRGHINVESKHGEGTTVTLRLPLTLAFLEAMVARVGNRLFVLAMEEILEIFKMNLEDVRTISATGESVFHHRGELVSFCSLVDFYGLEGTKPSPEETVVIVMETTFGKIAISVDELLGYQQVTLKPLEGQMAGIRAGVGCALLRSGEVAIALDAERLHLRYN
jgi:two-component system chemotaxis sensor kinase CheA